MRGKRVDDRVPVAWIPAREKKSPLSARHEQNNRNGAQKSIDFRA
jgi:hypothetical protein